MPLKNVLYYIREKILKKYFKTFLHTKFLFLLYIMYIKQFIISLQNKPCIM